MTINELEQKIAELQKEVEKMKSKKVVRERLKTYWFVSYRSDIINRCDDGQAMADWDFTIGNYFETEEQAEKYKQKIILTQKYKDFIDAITEVSIDWNDIDQFKYYLYYDIEHKTINSSDLMHITDMNIYTTNENLLDLAKERFTYDELKIIIGVE